MTSYSALLAEARVAGVESAYGRPRSERDYAALDRPDHDQHETPPESCVGRSGSHQRRIRCTERIHLPARPGRRELPASDLREAGRAGRRRVRAARPSTSSAATPLQDFGIADEWRPVARTMVEPYPRGTAPRAGRGWPWRYPLGRSHRWKGDHRPWGQRKERLSAVRPGAATRRAGVPLSGVRARSHPPRRAARRIRLPGPVRPGRHPAWEKARHPPGEPIRGFLRGFVDLVVEHDGPLVHHRTTSRTGSARLPATTGPPRSPKRCARAATRSQYLLYLVALHRYLSTRLPGYDYERHVGGVFYLFVRGIDPAARMRRGVYFDRPPAACLHALEDCFRGGRRPVTRIGSARRGGAIRAGRSRRRRTTSRTSTGTSGS